MESKDKGNNDVKIVVMEENNAKEDESLKKETDNQIDVPVSCKAIEVDSISIESNQKLTVKTLQSINDLNLNKRRASSISSVGNWTGAVIVSEVQPTNKNSTGKWYI